MAFIVMKKSIGGLRPVIDPRGSRFATAGRIRGWMPVPSTARDSESIVLLIDGVAESVAVVSYAGAPVPAGQGYVERYLFEIDLPPTAFGHAIVVTLVAESGSSIGISDLHLNVDEQGDAILARLNDDLREVKQRAFNFAKRGKHGNAHVEFQNVICSEMLQDKDALLVAARAAAEVHDLQAAEVLLNFATRIKASNPSTDAAVAKLLLKLGRFSDALEAFDELISHRPEAFDLQNGRIKALIGLERWRAALLEACRHRVNLESQSQGYAELSGTIAWLNLNLSQPERAFAETTLALRSHPNNTRLMQIRGDALVRLSRYSEAIEDYRRALMSDPKAALIRKRLGAALLLIGEFAEASDHDEGRMLTPTFAKLNNVPEGPALWRGDLGLDGKLLVWAEVNFGVGQNILHGSLLADLLTLGLDVVLEVEKRLVPVFASAFPTITVVEQVMPGQDRGAWLQDVKYHIPIGSLVRYFRRSKADYGASKPFLKYNVARARELRTDLEALSGRKRRLVGISWTSNNPYVGDEKSIPLTQMLTALDVPGVQLVNLQYGDHSESINDAIRSTGVTLIEASVIDRTNDSAGMCDLVAAMDMVVCIGHTTAHLAGGLGVPNLVLVPSSPFPHWLASGETCVWYPRSRIVRQTLDQRGDWAAALARAGEYVARTMLGLDLPEIVADPLQQARRSVTVNPKEVFCRNALSLAMSDYNYSQIGGLIDEVVRNFQSNAELQILAGDALYRIGEFEAALNCYDQAIMAGGDGADITLRKVEVLLECYELDEAASLIRKLLSDDPGIVVTRPDIVVVEAQIMACQNQPLLVIEKLRPITENEPNNVEAILALASAYSARGEPDKALRVLTPALEGPINAEVISAIGVLMGQAGLAGYAGKLIQNAKMYNPDPLGTFWLAQFEKAKVVRGTGRFNANEVTLPKEAEDRVTVFVCMDSVYCLRHLGSIAASIAANSPESNLHVHLVNPSEKALRELEGVRDLLGDDRLSYSKETTKLVQFSDEQQKTYFASIRFVRLAETMQAAPGTYFVMDVDNLVRADLSYCRSLTYRTDVLIRNRFSQHPHLAVAACGIILADSKAARAFVQRAADYILDAFQTGHVAWFLDQIALTMAMRELQADQAVKLKVSQLPRTLLDWDFIAESAVWTGKGKRRFKNQRYQAEYNRYAEQFHLMQMDRSNSLGV